MNADMIRHFLNYHLAENRALWDTHIMALTPEQFTAPVDYSIGSVRNHVVHLMSVDDTWLCGLRGVELPEPLEPTQFADRATIRVDWDRVEADMRAYLDGLTDDMLLDQPFEPGEDETLTVWQVLLHLVNHGTDHRAQVLRILHDMGAKTVSQDYIFYVYDNP